MTWHTELGDRCLTGPEATLFRRIVGYMHDSIGGELEGDTEKTEYGVPLFDELTPAQKLALLEQVLRQLLEPTEAPPKLNAMNEGAIAAIYSAVNKMVTTEIELGRDRDFKDLCDVYYWRRLLLKVASADDADSGDLPTAKCRDFSEWDSVLDAITSRVLWDDDYLDAEAVLDATPEAAQHHRDKLGIENDYFIAVAPDPKEAELPAIRERLRALCRDEHDESE